MNKMIFYFPERINSCVPKPEPEFRNVEEAQEKISWLHKRLQTRAQPTKFGVLEYRSGRPCRFKNGGVERQKLVYSRPRSDPGSKLC
jgi:hypothetical protein